MNRNSDSAARKALLLTKRSALVNDLNLHLKELEVYASFDCTSEHGLSSLIERIINLDHEHSSIKYLNDLAAAVLNQTLLEDPTVACPQLFLFVSKLQSAGVFLDSIYQVMFHSYIPVVAKEVTSIGSSEKRLLHILLFLDQHSTELESISEPLTRLFVSFLYDCKVLSFELIDFYTTLPSQKAFNKAALLCLDDTFADRTSLLCVQELEHARKWISFCGVSSNMKQCLAEYLRECIDKLNDPISEKVASEWLAIFGKNELSECLNENFILPLKEKIISVGQIPEQNYSALEKLVEQWDRCIVPFTSIPLIEQQAQDFFNLINKMLNHLGEYQKLPSLSQVSTSQTVVSTFADVVAEYCATHDIKCQLLEIDRSGRTPFLLTFITNAKQIKGYILEDVLYVESSQNWLPVSLLELNELST